MNRTSLLPLLILLIASCRSLPAIDPVVSTSEAMAEACEEVFPRRPWRMVHSIKTDLPGGRRGVMIGVVALAPGDRTVACALLSIEGLRLFEAQDDGTLTVRRALPPFDQPALAEGMMQDIRMLFFPPANPPLVSGRMASGNPGCRYALTDGYQDIIRQPTGALVIQRYDQRNRLTRRVHITRCRPENAGNSEALPCRIRLEAFQPAEYRLDLELVEARPIVDSP
ncbi:MAG: hypothetical protein PVJ53_02940 [Desulfobacterales bacterium]|jgi:hypothetical protein